MIYASFPSFCDLEVSSAWMKEHVLRAIAVAQEEKQHLFDTEYNVYQLIIRFEEGQVELWDAIYYDEKQEPYTMTLQDFLVALNAYVPPK
ncbi:hypothetical protein [Hymenobacter metallicola]|uniref:Uncharacterized protein n=1 Tax=Hymenobacter metallicola TaxID=2563114 RepID=A0A4Z0PT94_9BACT|nr:hypothetical protein [Hymenobacter metallicola]TGE20970.1 hypothetical protein E5K02_24715 [Hymenobacter metallicola]